MMKNSYLYIAFAAVIGLIVYFLFKKKKKSSESVDNDMTATVYIESNPKKLDDSDASIPVFCKWNNPLNIRFSKSNDWEGQINPPKNGAFCEFLDVYYGTRAAVKNMLTYFDKYGLRTVKQIIEKWAPVTDGNRTDAYIDNVCSRMSVSKDEILNLKNKLTVSKLVAAMSMSEKAKGESVSVGFVSSVIDKFGLLV